MDVLSSSVVQGIILWEFMAHVGTVASDRTHAWNMRETCVKHAWTPFLCREPPIYAVNPVRPESTVFQHVRLDTSYRFAHDCAYQALLGRGVAFCRQTWVILSWLHYSRQLTALAGTLCWIRHTHSSRTPLNRSWPWRCCPGVKPCRCLICVWNMANWFLISCFYWMTSGWFSTNTVNFSNVHAHKSRDVNKLSGTIVLICLPVLEICWNYTVFANIN